VFTGLTSSSCPPPYPPEGGVINPHKILIIKDFNPPLGGLGGSVDTSGGSVDSEVGSEG